MSTNCRKLCHWFSLHPIANRCFRLWWAQGIADLVTENQSKINPGSIPTGYQFMTARMFQVHHIYPVMGTNLACFFNDRHFSFLQSCPWQGFPNRSASIKQPLCQKLLTSYKPFIYLYLRFLPRLTPSNSPSNTVHFCTSNSGWNVACTFLYKKIPQCARHGGIS